MTRYQPTRSGVKETSRSEHRYKAWGQRVPSMGPKKCLLLATPCFTLSLALVALGGSDPTGKFCLGTLSIGRPHGNHGAHFGYGCCILWCRGRSYEELVWYINLCLLHYFTTSAKAHRFASSIAKWQGIKLAVTPMCNLRPLTWSPIVSMPPSLHGWKLIEIGKQI
jgi:hypothetical protein